MPISRALVNEVKERVKSAFVTNEFADDIKKAINSEKSYFPSKNLKKVTKNNELDVNKEAKEFLTNTIDFLNKNIKSGKEELSQKVNELGELTKDLTFDTPVTVPNDFGFDKKDIIKNHTFTGQAKDLKKHVDEDIEQALEILETETLQGKIKELENSPYYVLPLSTASMQSF